MRKVAAVFLLAENRLLREALIRLLGKRSELRIVGASAYSSSVQHVVIASKPQILLVDASGSWLSKLALISTLRSTIRDLQVIIVDMDADEELFLEAIRAGVVGYVLKDASAADVAAAIREVAAGRAVCPPSLCEVLFRLIAKQSPAQPPISWRSDLGLSRREQQMVELLSHRLTNKEIALRLNLSEQTVKNHVHHILRKTGAPNRFSVAERCENKLTRENSRTVVAIGRSERVVNAPGRVVGLLARADES